MNKSESPITVPLPTSLSLTRHVPRRSHRQPRRVEPALSLTRANMRLSVCLARSPPLLFQPHSTGTTPLAQAHDHVIVDVDQRIRCDRGDDTIQLNVLARLRAYRQDCAANSLLIYTSPCR